MSVSADASGPLLRRVDPRVLRRAARIIKLMGHPQRLKIVEVLETGQHTVGELCQLCGLGQVVCSQHLSRLRAARVASGAGRREALSRLAGEVERQPGDRAKLGMLAGAVWDLAAASR